MKKNKIYNIINNMMDYLMAFLLILSCGSVYDNINNVNLYISECFLIILFIRVLILIFKNVHNNKNIKKCIIFSLIYILYQTFYVIYHLNKRNVNNDIIVYVAKMIFTILLLILYYVLCEENKFKIILDKISKIVLFISIISLFFFILGSIFQLIKYTNLVEINFGKLRQIKSYFMVYFEAQATILFNKYTTRNCAIFCEAPMFSIVLLISLSYELFIKKDKKIVNIIIYYLTILSTISTTGIVVGAILGIIKIAQYIYIKIKNRKCNKIIYIISILLILIAIIVGVIAIKDKLKSPSFKIRMDDYLAGFKAWNDHKIMGNGYHNYEYVDQYTLIDRNIVGGQSNSLLNLLAEGGIWNLLVYFIPFIILTIKYIKNKDYNSLIFLLTLLVIFSTIIFTYTIMILNFVAYGWSKMLKKQEVEKKINKSNIKIYIVTHKKIKVPALDGYEIIQVGTKQNENLGYLRDNTGDNISIKNPNYCELTALYWMWKNSASNIIGLVHYRRYFFSNAYSKNINNILNEEEIEKIMQEYDIIIPKENFIYKYNIEEQYKSEHNIEDYIMCKKIIEQNTPEYLEAFDIVSKRKYFYPYNMFIMKKEKLNEYAEWLFSILFELEKNIDISQYSDYNKRVYGFLAERLFNVWLEKNNELKIKKNYVNNIESIPIIDNFKNMIKKIMIKNNE